MRRVENAEGGKCGVWKMQSGMLTNLLKKSDASLHFLDAQFVLYTNALVYTNVYIFQGSEYINKQITEVAVN